MSVENVLTLDEVLPAVQNRIDALLRLEALLKSRVQKAPAGKLGGYRCHSCWQWYKTLGARGTKKYLPRRKNGEVRQLAQKKYDSLMLDEIHKQLEILDHFVQEYNPERTAEVFGSLSDEWRKMTTPVPLPQKDYADLWLAKKFRGKKFSAESPVLLSSNGTRVRSKSEIIIANELTSLGIPFRYEYPYEMVWKDDGGVQKGVVHPDFTCLNVRTRREFIWEHFGRMDDDAYANGTIEKLENYERNGFSVGENLIFSMETAVKPMIPEKARYLAQKYLL